jgi:hypothetical protein
LGKKDKDVEVRRKGGRGKRRPLRGETLVNAALAVLSRWVNLSPETHPINISRLAKELGVTRQSIYDNELEKVVDEHKALQHKNFSIQKESVVLRKPLEERIASMEEEILDLRRKLDGWIERWVAVEYNARLLGLDADKIFAPMSPPDRMLVNVGSGKNGKDDDDE